MIIPPFVQGIIVTLIAVVFVLFVRRLYHWIQLGYLAQNRRSIFEPLRRIWHTSWRRKGVILGYTAIILLFVFAAAEWAQIINFVPIDGNSELLRIAPVLSAFGTIALTFGLVILYDRQAAVLEQQYQPYLIGEVESRSVVTTQFVVRNTGDDYAYNIEAEWTVAGDTRVWETPSLAPGESAAFPLLVDEEDGWMLHTQQIREYFDDNDASSEIHYEIRCEDQFRIPRRYRSHVDFGVMSQREDSHEIWEIDPMESIASSASSIEASIDAIASDIDDRRDEHKWQDRWSKQRAILRIVKDIDQIPMEVLSRILATREDSLEYRISELDAAGYINYDKNNGVVKSDPGAGDNHTLSDFI